MFQRQRAHSQHVAQSLPVTRRKGRSTLQPIDFKSYPSPLLVKFTNLCTKLWCATMLYVRAQLPDM